MAAGEPKTPSQKDQDFRTDLLTLPVGRSRSPRMLHEAFSPQVRGARTSELIQCTPPGRGLVTPDRLPNGLSPTPPPAPSMWMEQFQFEHEVDTAVASGSLSLLSVALFRGHGSRCMHGCHCLHEAVTQGRLEALRFLLKRCPRVVDEHCAGCRSLHLAIQMTSQEGDIGYQMADLLLHHGASPNKVRGDGMGCEVPLGCSRQAVSVASSPLHYATSRRVLPMVKLLLRYGADPDATGADGRMPLHLACAPDRTPAFLLGREQGISFVRSWCGEELQIVEALLEGGAAPAPTDAAGQTPAEGTGNLGVLDTLTRADRWRRRRAAAWLRAYGKAKGAVEGDEGASAAPASTWTTPAGLLARLFPEHFRLVARYL